MHKDHEEIVESIHSIKIQETLYLQFSHVQQSLNSKVPSCEIHFMTEKNTIVAANDGELSSPWPSPKIFYLPLCFIKKINKKIK